MGMSQCKKCGTEVNTQEETCSVCGAPINKRPIVHYLYAFAAIILVLVGAIHMYDFFDEKQKEQEKRKLAALAAQLEIEENKKKIEEGKRVQAEQALNAAKLKQEEEENFISLIEEHYQNIVTLHKAKTMTKPGKYLCFLSNTTKMTIKMLKVYTD
jgi:uncharacterized protein HemX